ncbi:MAG: four helix bundle protein [Candidatus Levybacteria bacterium]|nr:four helix bundle protein [Candidatus Levybacteria bacterium]
MLFRFRNFPVYKKAKEFRKLVKNILKKFPDSEKFNLTNQVNRAVDSICLNIAEGSNRLSDKDKAHFLNQALTSLEEVVSGFDLALDDGYITNFEMSQILKKGEELGKQLIGFSKSLTKT